MSSQVLNTSGDLDSVSVQLAAVFDHPHVNITFLI